MKKNHERIVKRNGKNQIGSERYAVMRKNSGGRKGKNTRSYHERGHRKRPQNDCCKRPKPREIFSRNTRVYGSFNLWHADCYVYGKRWVL